MDYSSKPVIYSGLIKEREKERVERPRREPGERRGRKGGITDEEGEDYKEREEYVLMYHDVT